MSLIVVTIGTWEGSEGKTDIESVWAMSCNHHAAHVWSKKRKVDPETHKYLSCGLRRRNYQEAKKSRKKGEVSPKQRILPPPLLTIETFMFSSVYSSSNWWICFSYIWWISSISLLYNIVPIINCMICALQNLRVGLMLNILITKQRKEYRKCVKS